MLQGHIYFLFVKENATQKKGAHQRKTLRHAPGTYTKPKNLSSSFI